MALYRRGQVWYADYYALQGKRIQESTGTANRREAEKFLALRISEVQRGVYVKPVVVSLKEFGGRFLEYAKTHKRSWRRDEQMLGHLERHFGEVNLTDIQALGVEQYQQKRIKESVPRPSTGSWHCSSTCSISRSDGACTEAEIPCAWSNFCPKTI